MVVPLGELRVYLNSVGVLNDSFAILAFGKILFTAVKVLLLARIGIARAPSEQNSNDRTRKQQADNYRAAHFRSSDRNCRGWTLALVLVVSDHNGRLPRKTVTAVIAWVRIPMIH